MCLELYRALCRKLRAKLFASLYRELYANSFQSLFRTFFAALFGSLFESKNAQLWALLCLALNRQMLPGRRSPGRPLPGRIVALIPGHTIPCGHANPSLEYRSHDKSSYQADSLSCHCKFFTLRSLPLTRWK